MSMLTVNKVMYQVTKGRIHQRRSS